MITLMKHTHLVLRLAFAKPCSLDNLILIDVFTVSILQVMVQLFLDLGNKRLMLFSLFNLPHLESEVS